MPLLPHGTCGSFLPPRCPTWGTPTATADARSTVLLRSRARARRTDLSHRSKLLFRVLHSSPSPQPPCYSLPVALSAAAILATLPEGHQLHAVFRRVPDGHRMLVSWNTTVNALACNGDHLATLDLFREMQCDGPDLEPDSYTVQSVLGACATADALSLGLYAHALLLRELNAADDRASLSTALPLIGTAHGGLDSGCPRQRRARASSARHLLCTAPPCSVRHRRGAQSERTAAAARGPLARRAAQSWARRGRRVRREHVWASGRDAHGQHAAGRRDEMTVACPSCAEARDGRRFWG